MRATICLALLSCLSLYGCGHFKTAPAPVDALTRAINNEWSAKVNKDWGAVYDLATQSFKTQIKKNDFIKYANLDVLDYNIKDVQIGPDGETATAVIDYTALTMGYKIPMTAKEKWVSEKGGWRLEMPPGIQSPIDAGK